MSCSFLMRNCKYCKSEFVSTWSKHYVSCQFRKSYYDCIKLIQKDLVYDFYVVKGHSVLDLMYHFKLFDRKDAEYLLQLASISVRSLKESASHPSVRAKASATNVKNTGYAHNFSKGAPSKIKSSKKLMDLYGVINVFQRQDVKEKSKATLLEKYGEDHPMKINQFKDKLINTRIEKDLNNPSWLGRSSYSSIHFSVVKFLQSIGVNCKIEYKIKRREPGRFYSYDIYIGHKLIEVNGDYYHANPRFYKSTDIIVFKGRKSFSAQEIWNSDKAKLEHAVFSGHEVLVIWENDLKNSMTYDVIKQYAESKD